MVTLDTFTQLTATSTQTTKWKLFFRFQGKYGCRTRHHVTLYVYYVSLYSYITLCRTYTDN
jgi:hypothetical protein